jgi:pantetheine-phosphate adenylyltransferase
MKALYVGSFDPFTLGHLNIVLRACAMFPTVTIGIGNNPSKKYMFSVEERIALIKAIPSIKKHNVSVVEINNLTADYARINGYTHLIKGARTAQDFDYEKLINEITLTQQRNLETILLFSDTKLSHVSSSASKALAKFQGLVHDYLPLNIKEAVEAKLGQAIVGVTGIIGAGKSTFCKYLVDEMQHEFGCTIHHVNMDLLAHRLLTETTPLAEEVRGEILREFGTSDRKALGEIVFGNKDKLNVLNSIYREPILTLLREELRGKKGIVLLEGALLAELDWLFLCNNNVILVREPESKKYLKRLRKRGYSDTQVNNRLQSQYTYHDKKVVIGDKILKDGHGVIWTQVSEMAMTYEVFQLLHRLGKSLT